MSALQAASLIQPGDRIVFVGDSITGQGGNGGAGGWVGLIGSGLKNQNPESHQVLVALGGSGQTVGGWTNVERKSRTAPTFLDVKTFDLQVELGQHADVVVIMLGMNDVLSPSMAGTPESIQKWSDNYRLLINALRERTTPRLVALATPTPCTEDPVGPKNVVMDKMVEALTKLAAEEKCIVLPTRALSWEILDQGRRLKPDFHFVGDQVHPNPYGHAAIAAGMLKGFGEVAASTATVEKALASLKAQAGADALSYQWSLPPQMPAADGSLRFQLNVYHPTGQVKAEFPEGWSSKETAAKTGSGETVFLVTAKLDRLVNRVVLRAGSVTREATIPAPWLVGSGNIGRVGWKANVYDREAGKLPADEAVRTGVGFAEAMPQVELKPGVPLVWKPFVSSVNYGGNGAPGAVDFAGITFFSGGEVGYGLRWIQSDKEREVTVKIAKLGFAGSPYLEVWSNGETVFTGDSAKARGQDFKTTLKAGWNLISFKSNFSQWQWQFSIDLEPAAGDSLDALRYSIVPR